MSIISYARNFEDVMLNRVFCDTSDGFYIDVGAWHPVIESVTMHFYSRGWSGINIEPAGDRYALLMTQRPRDVNLRMALGELEGEATLYEVVSQGVSTLDRDLGEEYRKTYVDVRQVPIRVTTLNAICERYAQREIDFLKIDVGGSESQVIAGGDWQRFRPRVVLVDSTASTAAAACWEEWEPVILSHGYDFVYFDGLNRFYLRREDRDLGRYFSVPPNVSDRFTTYAMNQLQRQYERCKAELDATRSDQHSVAGDRTSWSPRRLSPITRVFRRSSLLPRLQRFSVFARRQADHPDSSGDSFLSRLGAQVVGTIWKALRHAIPPGLRGKVKDWLLEAAAPEPIRNLHGELRFKDLAEGEFGINVIGHITAEMGLGEAVRGSARAAAVSGIPAAVIDFRDGFAGRMREEAPGALSSRPNYGVSLFHIGAPELFEHSMRFADLEPSRTYNIGFWFWETSELPDSWMPAFNYLDEIWAASTFCLDVFSRKSPVPVVRIPVCVEPVPAASLSREDLGLPRSGFLFLSMADFFSGPERKNPLGALEAFQRAFPSRSEEAYLALKVTNSEHRPEVSETVRERVKADQRIILFDGYLDRPELNALIHNCDCLVSLHRAEGFGLPIAEAMYMGKPAIATGWSANMDFMTIDNSLPVRYQLIPVNQTSGPYRDCKGFWADPDVDHAAQQMRRVVFDASLAEALGRAARKTMREEYSAEAVGQLMRQRLQIIYDRLRRQLSERD